MYFGLGDLRAKGEPKQSEFLCKTTANKFTLTALDDVSGDKVHVWHQPIRLTAAGHMRALSALPDS